MDKKDYIKPMMDIIMVDPQRFNLPSSVPGGFPGIAEIKADPFNEADEELNFNSDINAILW